MPEFFYKYKFAMFTLLASILLASIAFYFYHNRASQAGNDLVQIDTVDSLQAFSESKVQLENTPSDLTLTDFLSGSAGETYKESLLNNLPDSLSGVPLPELLDVDSLGNLILNKKIKSLFEYYLGALGEESLEVIIKRIHWELQDQLEEPSLSQAKQILNAYVQYSNELELLKKQNLNPSQAAGLANILDDVKSLKLIVKDRRHSYFDQELIQAFFSEDDQYDDYMLSRSEILLSDNLTEAEKDQALRNLESVTETSLLEQVTESNEITQYLKQEATLSKKGANPAQVYALRQETFGVQAADNLKKLDESRKDWQKKLTAYRSELALIAVQYTDRRSPEYQSQLQALRAKYFSGPELNRIHALDIDYFSK